MNSSTSCTYVGSIDEGGFIKGLLRKGFNPRNCLLELFANCLDADAHNVQFRIASPVIRIVDDGIGMKADGAANMASMHRENHSARPKRGVSGIGCKPAGILLSERRPVTYFTHMQGGSYLCITFPWNDVIRENRYTGKVSIRDMTSDEIATFQAERTTEHGTTIVFPYSDMLKEAIMDNFRSIDDEHIIITNPEERIGVVFGADDVVVTLQEVGSELRTLAMYDYFGQDNSHYYGGKQVNRIEQYQNRTDSSEHRFILYGTDGTSYEIQRHGAGFTKEPKECVVNVMGFRLVGEYNVTVGVRKDVSIYNEVTRLRYSQAEQREGAYPMTANEEETMGAYNGVHLGNEKVTIPFSRTFRQNNKVRRNNQIIGTFETPDITASSARANPTSLFKMSVVQLELRFNPISNQDNPQDQAIGVQENKNQLNGKAIPIQLTRLVKFIKEQKAKAIWDAFPPFVRGEQQEPPEQPDEDEDADEDADDEDADDEDADEAADEDADDADADDDEDDKSEPEPLPNTDDNTPNPQPNQPNQPNQPTVLQGNVLIQAFNNYLARHNITEQTATISPEATSLLAHLNSL